MKDIVKKDNGKSSVTKFLEDISKASSVQQIGIGSVSGWVTGIIFIKTGKAAAISVGGGIILLQIAHKKGYITVNWNKINKNAANISKKVEKTINDNTEKWFEKFTEYAKTNSYFALSFLGGFLIGIAT